MRRNSPDAEPKTLGGYGAFCVIGSVFDVINMLKRNMVAGAAVDMIDRDQGMVALRERNVVIGLR